MKTLTKRKRRKKRKKKRKNKFVLLFGYIPLSVSAMLKDNVYIRG